MISDENIATAQIAQIFGSELLKAQQSARTDTGSVPHFVKMDPKQFLVSETKTAHQQRAEEQRLIQMLQREAEAACPLPESSQSLPSALANVSSPMLQTQSTILQPQPDVVVGRVTTTSHLPQIASDNVMERIAISLESIANSLEKIDIVAKKRKTKRTKKLNEISH